MLSSQMRPLGRFTVVMTWLKTARGRHIRHRRNPNADQRRGGVEPFRVQQGFEQGVFVLAISISVRQHLPGTMWLVSAHAEIDADISHPGRDEAVDGLHLIFGSLCIFRDFFGSGAQRVVGCARSAPGRGTNPPPPPNYERLSRPLRATSSIRIYFGNFCSFANHLLA